jgi:hypothetical protein
MNDNQSGEIPPFHLGVGLIDVVGNGAEEIPFLCNAAAIHEENSQDSLESFLSCSSMTTSMKLEDCGYQSSNDISDVTSNDATLDFSDFSMLSHEDEIENSTCTSLSLDLSEVQSPYSPIDKRSRYEAIPVTDEVSPVYLQLAKLEDSLAAQTSPVHIVRIRHVKICDNNPFRSRKPRTGPTIDDLSKLCQV